MTLSTKHSTFPAKLPVIRMLCLLAFAAPAFADVQVTISPTYAVVQLNGTLQLNATVTGTGNTTVTWQVNNANGGTATDGTVSSSGLYFAPSTLTVPAAVTVTAVSQADPSKSATSVITLVTQPAQGQTYYVSTSGKDSNPGTLASPWRTIQHAANSVHAGDTVYVREGMYNEIVTMKSSGSAGAGFITFASYSGELAIVDGTGLKIPGGQWGLFTVRNQSYIVITGFEVRNYKTNSKADTPIGIYLSGAGTNLQIINNHIHNIETHAKTNPKQCGSNAFGLTVDGTKAPDSINSLAIMGNEVDHLLTGCSETLSVDGNVEQFAITNNLIHDDNNIGLDGIGFEHVSPDPKYDQARDGVFRGNTVFNITSFGNPDYGPQYAADGIYIDGGTRIIIEQNLIYTVDLGIEIASEHPNHVASFVTARNNVIYSDTSNGISLGGSGGGNGGTDHCTVVNNTMFADDAKNTFSGEFQIQHHATNNVFKNNIAYATTQALFLHNQPKKPAPPADIDYNLYYSTVGDKKGRWMWEGTIYKGYSNYTQSTGLDGNSPPFSDPQFISTGNPVNLDIQPTSPAVNAGINLGVEVVGAYDFAGNPRTQNGLINIGAYEQ